MFGLMQHDVRRYVWWVGLVFMAGSLSFLSFSVFGEQEGICVDCVKGDQTEQEIQNFKKLTCEAQLKKPECKIVSDIFRPDCDNLPKNPEAWASAVCVPMFFGSMAGVFFLAKAIFAWGTNIFNVQAARVAVTVGRVAPWAAVGGVAAVAAYLAVQYHNQVKKVKIEAIQRGIDPEDEEGIKKAAGQGFSYFLAEKFYDLVYGDSHCYNEITRATRVCGMLSALSAISGVTGSVSLGLAGATTGSFNAWMGGAVGGAIAGIGVPMSMQGPLKKQYEEVRDDVQKRIQAAKDQEPPSATEQVDQLLQEASQ